MFGRNEIEKQADLEIFAIYDSKAKAYRPPAYSKNKFTAVREVENVMKQNKDHEYNTNSEDFKIFKLGSYDFQTGLITSHPPEHVTNLHELKAPVQ